MKQVEKMTIKEYSQFRSEGIDWEAKTGPSEWGKKKWNQRTAELYESIQARIK